MFSSEKNIEQIASLIEKLKRFIELKTDYLKYDSVEKGIRLLSALVSIFIVGALVVLALFYLSFAIASWLAPVLGVAGGYCAVAAFFVLLVVLVCIFRRQWIEKPILKLFTDIFLNK